MTRQAVSALAALAIIVVLLVPVVASPAIGQQAGNATQENGTQPGSGEYTITELRGTGIDQGNSQVPSVRSIGSPPRGFVAARYRDPTLIDAMMGDPGQWRQISMDKTVRQNEVQVYGSAFGESAGDYTLVIVFWQRAETENGTAYAANQTVNRRQITFRESDLYTYANVSLPQHLDRTWKTTMWLEQDGGKVHGVQWRFDHRSNPESTAISIDSAAGAWGFALANAVIPGIVSLILGLVAARGVIRVAGRGPGYGIGAWLILVFFVGMIVSTTAYYQIAVILSNLPMVMGLSFGVIAFGAGLTFHQPVQTIAFLRRELEDADVIPGGTGSRRPATNEQAERMEIGDAGAELFDEFTEALYIDLPEVPAVRTDDGYRVPVTGLRPFFARIWADAALLDLTNIATRTKVNIGRIDDIITVDPKTKPAVEHKPARMVRVLPWDTLDDDAKWTEELWAGVMTAMILLGPAAVGYMAFGALNIPGVGAAVGVGATAVMAYSAEDGWIEFVQAPQHYKRAEDSLTLLQRAYKVAEEEASATEKLYKERGKSAAEARDERTREEETMTRRVLDSLGVGTEEGGADGTIEDGD